MCSNSATLQAVQEVLGSESNSKNASVTIFPSKVYSNSSDYILVDVREPAEREASLQEDSQTWLIDNSTNYSLGYFLRDLADDTGLVEKLGEGVKNKKIVTFCNVGYRSGIACSELRKFGYDAYSLEMGIFGFSNYAALTPGWILVLSNEDPEKLTVAFALANGALTNGSTAVIAFMGPAVNYGLICNDDSLTAKCQNVNVGEPFKPVKAMVDSFLKRGGIVFCCRSCVKHRKYVFEKDIASWIKPISAPDISRMQLSSRASQSL